MKKEIKRAAIERLKNHYFRNVIVVFITSIILTGGSQLIYKVSDFDSPKEKIKIVFDQEQKSNSEILNEVLEKSSEEINDEEKIKQKYNEGILSVFFYQIKATDSFILGIFNALNILIFKEKISVFLLLLFSSVFSLVLFLLIFSVISIGKARYFLEHRRYNKTKVDKILFPYKVRRTLALSEILFFKYLYQFLWNFTIIGGIKKRYEYYLIPYILAENPQISRSDAFELSKEMTEGYKMSIFKLELSMLPWVLLSFFTLKLSSIFISDIYFETLKSELYMKIRRAKKSKLSKGYLLNDQYLEISQIENTKYPDEKFSIPLSHQNRLLTSNYFKKYSLTSYILLFFSFSIIGWLWEVFLTVKVNGTLVNKGALLGPWLPIYGSGGILILILLKKYRTKPHLIFLYSLLICGLVEYITSWYLETFKNLRWWDYTHFFLNVKGRICLEALILFGILGCAITYVVAPILDNLFKKIPISKRKALCFILIIIFSIDFIHSQYHPNVGKNITFMDNTKLTFIIDSQ